MDQMIDELLWNPALACAVIILAVWCIEIVVGLVVALVIVSRKNASTERHNRRLAAADEEIESLNRRLAWAETKLRRLEENLTNLLRQ